MIKKMEDCITEKAKEVMTVSADRCKEGFYYVEIYGSIHESRVGSYVLVKDKIELDIEKTRDVTKKTFFGTKTVQEKYYDTKIIGIYAKKEKEGLYEMVTGRRLTVTDKMHDSVGFELGINDTKEPLYCIGIREIYSEEAYARAGMDLQYLEENPEVKEQYIEKLNKLGEEAKKLQQEYEKQVNDKETAKTFFKRYKPGNSQD